MENISDENTAIIKVDIKSIIVYSNSYANIMLECDSCVNKSINDIVPAALSLSHPSFIDDYLKSGSKCILDKLRIVRMRTFANNIIQVYQIINDVDDDTCRFISYMRYYNYRCSPDKLIERLVPKNLADEVLLAGDNNHRSILTVSLKDYENVAILFADISGFTLFSTKHSNRIVAEMFYHLYSSFDDLVLSYPDVYKIETAGDSYVVISNIVNTPNIAEQGLLQIYKLALRMGEVAERIFTYNEKYNTLGLRIGISYGSLAGGITEHVMPRFHVWGCKVNLSARLQQHCELGSILVDTETYKILSVHYVKLNATKQTLYFKGLGATECWLIPLILNVSWVEHRQHSIQQAAMLSPTDENAPSDTDSKPRRCCPPLLGEQPRSPSFREYIKFEKKNSSEFLLSEIKNNV
jgi:class 3 adenylate cyclase